MSYVLCPMSYVLCPMSSVLCPMSWIAWCPGPPGSYIVWIALTLALSRGFEVEPDTGIMLGWRGTEEDAGRGSNSRNGSDTSCTCSALMNRGRKIPLWIWGPSAQSSQGKSTPRLHVLYLKILTGPVIFHRFFW
jgi:hypothetical protein